MKLNQLALQIYTLRTLLRDTKEIVAGMQKLRKIGYTTVELGRQAIPEDEMAKILAGEGLLCCGYHGNGEAVLKKPAEVIENAKKFGVDYVTCPYLPGFSWGDPASTQALVKNLDAAGEIFHQAGLTLTYHNHASEFVRVGDTTMLDYIYAHTDPAKVQAELDTYWVQYGGGNPTAWCRKLKNRLPLLHMKDYGFTKEDKPFFAAIGSGNLDWKEIIPAAESSGCKWFIVEQDTTPGDPFDAVTESFQFIKNNLVTA